MAHAIGITRRDESSSALRQQAAGCRDGRVTCRMLVIAHILDGATRTEVAAACGMARQTLRDWVHRYNGAGVAGLRDARRGGRPPVLSEAQMAELKELVLAGPDLATDGVVRWRCVDLRTAIKARFEVDRKRGDEAHIRRRLPGPRRGHRHRHARRQQRGDEPTPR